MKTLPWLVLGLALPSAGQAWADTVVKQCRQTSAQASFGTLSSLTVRDEAQRLLSGGGMSCDQSKGTLIGQSWIRMQIDRASDPVLTHGQTGEQVPFALYSSANATSALEAGRPYDYSTFTFLGNGPDLGSFPVYLRTAKGANVSAGTYHATIRLRWYWRICLNGQAFGICNIPGWDISPGLRGGCLLEACTLPPDTWGEGVPTSILVSLVVSPDCLITAPALDFGSAPLAQNFDTQQGNITIRCTKGALYSVGLNDGAQADGKTRRMANGGHYLAYELYKSRSSERWGATGSERRASTSAEINPTQYDGVSGQRFDYRARVLPEQNTPPAGIYRDSVVIDVQF
ncbi:Csu type fimbrial protein [Pseudomonas panipatensis]|uniref:Csu type fimbrial protein n=1 Tax=Pseudomonas panipatensis TaxID=428992 RepID=UPI0035AEB896